MTDNQTDADGLLQHLCDVFRQAAQGGTSHETRYLLLELEARACALKAMTTGTPFAQAASVGAVHTLYIDLLARLPRLPQVLETQTLQSIYHAAHQAAAHEIAAAQTLLFSFIPPDEGAHFRTAVTRLSALGDACSDCFDDELLYAVGEYAEAAANDFLQGAEWMYQKAALLNQPDEARAGAIPFQHLCALVLGAELLIDRALNGGEPERRTALFYCSSLLPQAKALSIQCSRGVYEDVVWNLKQDAA